MKRYTKFVIMTLIIVLLIIISFKMLLSYNISKLNKLSGFDFFKCNISENNEANADLKLEVSHAKVPTLMYHSITDDMSYIEYPINAVSPINFEKQLQYIRDNNYQTIFFEDLENLGKYTRPILLTFDDGFIDFYNEAFPLLKKYNQKATLFIIVGYISCENYCTVEQLKEMEESGLVDVQVHTQSHQNLTTIVGEKLEAEVVESKKILSKYLNNKQINSICYPYGAYNKKVSNLVSKNYTYAITMDEGCYDTKLYSLQEIPRYTIPRGISLNQFVNYISKSMVELKE